MFTSQMASSSAHSGGNAGNHENGPGTLASEKQLKTSSGGSPGAPWGGGMRCIGELQVPGAANEDSVCWKQVSICSSRRGFKLWSSVVAFAASFTS